MEELECLCTAGRTVKWCSHFRKCVAVLKGKCVSADAYHHPLDIWRTKKKASVAGASETVLQEARELARSHGMQRLGDHGHALDCILDVMEILRGDLRPW